MTTDATSRLVCLDVNETLLDLSKLDEVFKSLGGRAGRQAWFTTLLSLAQTVTLVGRYENFSELGCWALDQVAVIHGWHLDPKFKFHLADAMATLPAHPDAESALDRLRHAGYQLAALTNSTAGVARQQLAHEGLADLFDAVLSVDVVRRYKPAPEPYRMAASHFGVSSRQMWMVAAHDWDIYGAMAVGCRGVYIARGNSVFPANWPSPQFQVTSLQEAVAEIINCDLTQA